MTSSTDTAINQIEELEQEWEEKTLAASLRKMPESQSEFIYSFAKTHQRLYTPNDLADINFNAILAFSAARLTRGIHPTGYRARKLTMRQFADLVQLDTNERFKYLLEHGQTGL